MIADIFGMQSLIRKQGAATPEAIVEPEAPATEQTTEIPIRNGTKGPSDQDSNDIRARLDAAEKEREVLRTEVAGLRKSLEEVQGKHEEELSTTKQERDEAQEAKEKADAQYQTLLGRVNTIRSQLGERLKADAVRLARWSFFERCKADIEYRKNCQMHGSRSNSSKRRMRH